MGVNDRLRIESIKEAYKSLDGLVGKGTPSHLFEPPVGEAPAKMKEEYIETVTQARKKIAEAIKQSIPPELFKALKGLHTYDDDKEGRANKELATLAIFNLAMAAVFHSAKTSEEKIILQRQYKIFQEVGGGKEKSEEFLELQSYICNQIENAEPYTKKEKEEAYTASISKISRTLKIAKGEAFDVNNKAQYDLAKSFTKKCFCDEYFHFHENRTQ